MTNPFPSPYPTLLGADPLLQTYLSTAIAEALIQFPTLIPFRTAISFVAINETLSSKDFKHAGLRYGDSFFTGSLVKMGVLYAAYELRRSARNLASELGISTPPQMYARLKSDFNPLIKKKFLEILKNAKISLTPVNERVKNAVPNYEQIFTITPKAIGLEVDFTPKFQNNLKDMIIVGENQYATACIEALGYCWINGTLQSGGFFFPEGKTGIWVGGSFGGSLPPVRIPSVNDGEVAQASTCFDMANLYAHIFQRTLVDVTSSGEMGKLLSDSVTIGKDDPFLDYERREQLPKRDFTVTGSKIGLANLKSGELVASEGTVVKHTHRDGTERKFIVVFQNSLTDFKASLPALGYIVERTIKLFLYGP